MVVSRAVDDSPISVQVPLHRHLAHAGTHAQTKYGRVTVAIVHGGAHKRAHNPLREEGYCVAMETESSIPRTDGRGLGWFKWRQPKMIIT